MVLSSHSAWTIPATLKAENLYHLHGSHHNREGTAVRELYSWNTVSF